MIRRPPVLAAFLALAACVSAPPRPELAAKTPSFDPMVFFLGATEGVGVLQVAMSGTRAVHVHGTGHMEGDVLVLSQLVEREASKPAKREWHLHRTGPGRYAGTLTDARGPVSATANGNTLHITYSMKGPLRVEQWIYLQPNSRVALNRMTVRAAAVPIAALNETISRVN